MNVFFLLLSSVDQHTFEKRNAIKLTFLINEIGILNPNKSRYNKKLNSICGTRGPALVKHVLTRLKMQRHTSVMGMNIKQRLFLLFCITFIPLLLLLHPPTPPILVGI